MDNHTAYDQHDIQPSTPIHPGEMLKDELETRQISQRKFAGLIGCSYSVLNEIINGKRPITTEYALKIEAATDIKAYMWIEMQASYNLQTAKSDSRLCAILDRIRSSAAIL